jgi:hypothetical protein
MKLKSQIEGAYMPHCGKCNKNTVPGATKKRCSICGKLYPVQAGDVGLSSSSSSSSSSAKKTIEERSYCSWCKEETIGTKVVGGGVPICHVCNHQKNAEKVVAVPTILLTDRPVASVRRIICVGHGVYEAKDRKFIVPRNVTVRFRTTHGASTGGRNEKEVRLPEDLKFGMFCYNYRLCALTGSEAITVPIGTQDAKDFVRGWRADAGAETWLIVKTLGESVSLADIVYGLGGGASEGTGMQWEVLWLACREVFPNDDIPSVAAFLAKQLGERYEINYSS